MAGKAGPNVVKDGLVLNVDAANPKSYPGSGTTWYDLSGNGYSGNLTNGPTFSTANNGIIEFDGVNDACTLTSNFSGFTGITVNVFYFSNTSSNTALTRAVGSAYILHFRGAGFYIIDSNGSASGYLGWDIRPTGENWRMLTGTWDGTTMKLYQNGVKQSTERSFTGTGILRTFTSIQLAYYFNSSQPQTNGDISYFQIYDRALTSDEILQNYNATKSRFK